MNTTGLYITTDKDFNKELLGKMEAILQPCKLKLIIGKFHEIYCNMRLFSNTSFTKQQLKENFLKISQILSDDQKYFKTFFMDVSNYEFNFIENQFVDIYFKHINIFRCNGNIDINAFNGTSLFTIKFYLSVNNLNFDKVSIALNRIENLEQL